MKYLYYIIWYKYFIQKYNLYFQSLLDDVLGTDKRTTVGAKNITNKNISSVFEYNQEKNLTSNVEHPYILKNKILNLDKLVNNNN